MRILVVITFVFIIVSYIYSDLIFSNSLILLLKILPFWIGSLIAIKVSFSSIDNTPINYFIAVISIILVLCSTSLYRSAMIVNNLTHTFAIHLIITVSFCLFLIYAYRSKYIHKLIASNPLTFIGKISFSLYLMHMFILILLKDFHPLIVIVSIFSLSYLTYLFIEKPFIQLGAKIASNIQKNEKINDKI